VAATIEVKKLCKSFGDIQAARNISFNAYQREIIALLGPNGAGKSTLMNMMTGYLTPDSGSIRILGKDIADAPLEAKEKIGFLPEGSPLYPDMNVADFLRYMAELRGLNKDEQKIRLPQVSALAKIDNIRHQKIETLSKGYLRRVGFAQSILSDPPLLLLDEPTDGLDPNQKEHIRNLISEMSKQKTIMISTHLLEEAETVANRIILMNHGQILADGTLEGILKQQRCDTLEQAFKKLTR